MIKKTPHALKRNASRSCFLFWILGQPAKSTVIRNIAGQWNSEISIDKLFELYLKYSYPVPNFSNTFKGTELGVLCWKCRNYMCHGIDLWMLEGRSYAHNTVDEHISQLKSFNLLFLLCYRAFYWKFVHLSQQCLYFIQQLL